MRESHTVQKSIFDFYSQHEFSTHLEKMSRLLDEYPTIIPLIENDLIDEDCQMVGRKGLSVESVLRCLLLKKISGASYDKLAFHLSDSSSFRAFARIDNKASPGKSALQANIRRITPQTLQAVFEVLSTKEFKAGNLRLDALRIDSTVVKSNIAPPLDSQLLNDGVRVLSRYLAKCNDRAGVKIRFKDYRKIARSLSAQIFYSRKKTEKIDLYGSLLPIVKQVIKQVDRATTRVRLHAASAEAQVWLEEIEHYCELTKKVIHQTEQRVINEVKVPSSEKIVSLFEPHTDIIIKGSRDVDYGHKINLASDQRGIITGLMIEEGNPSDVERYLPMLQEHEALYGCLPGAVVADGGYASQDNVVEGRALGIQRVVFHKKRGITLRAMGVQEKTYEKLKNFRAGIEGNISELKRVFGAGKALWKGHDGFMADVWASVISYNLVRLVRLNPG